MTHPSTSVQEPKGCCCRWDADDKRVVTCERHQGWLDVIAEWADRARAAEAGQPWGSGVFASAPTSAEDAKDRERLDWLERTQNTVWRVTHEERYWTTMDPPQRATRVVFEGWSCSSTEEPHPTIREAIDAAMRESARKDQP